MEKRELGRPAEHSLAHYDPGKGLKKIAVAEAAERHFQRAKDATKLLQAVELKLTEQRKFVLWWDAQGDKRGRPSSKNVSDQKRLSDLGADRLTLHRWRVRLKDEEKFAAVLKQAQKRSVELVELRLHQGTKSESTENPEWYTPEEHLTAVRDVLGEIDLDPASSPAAQRRVKAARFFTQRDNGLERDWLGRVFLNPPYSPSQLLGQFVGKLVEEYQGAFPFSLHPRSAAVSACGAQHVAILLLLPLPQRSRL